MPGLKFATEPEELTDRAIDFHRRLIARMFRESEKKQDAAKTGEKSKREDTLICDGKEHAVPNEKYTLTCKQIDANTRTIHSTLSRTRRLYSVETHRAVFRWVLKMLCEEGLVDGKTVSIDATTLEANAALRSLVRRDKTRGALKLRDCLPNSSANRLISYYLS